MAVTPVFLPGKSHEGRSLVGYSPWGHKELDTTKWQKVKVKYIAHGTELNFMWQPGCQRNLEEGVCVCVCVCVWVTQLCLILQSPKLQPTRFLCPWNSPGKNTKVGCLPFSRGSPQPRDQTRDSCTAAKFFTVWGTREAPLRRMDTCICMAESLHSSRESITALLIGYTSIQNKV